MPATMERAVPYMALAKRDSSVGANVTFLSAAVGVFHQALRRRHDANAEAVQNARDVAVAEVQPATRSRNALQARDRGRTADVLHFHDEGLVALRVGARGKIGDITLRLEDRG